MPQSIWRKYSIMKNKNLILFIVIGFIVTTVLWGFVGGCGTSNISLKKEVKDVAEEDLGAGGPILKEASVEGITYVVNPGDTLWNLGKKFNVSVSSIKSANKLEKDTISTGQRLIIPVGQKQQETEPAEAGVGPVSTSEGPSSLKQTAQKTQAIQKQGTTVYKVRKNDSLWRIAQTCGTTIERIAELNGLSKNAKLTPGQEILVPNNEPH